MYIEFAELTTTTNAAHHWHLISPVDSFSWLASYFSVLFGWQSIYRLTATHVEVLFYTQQARQAAITTKPNRKITQQQQRSDASPQQQQYYNNKLIHF